MTISSQIRNVRSQRRSRVSLCYHAAPSGAVTPKGANVTSESAQTSKQVTVCSTVEVSGLVGVLAAAAMRGRAPAGTSA